MSSSTNPQIDLRWAKEFFKLYEERPVADNVGGMGVHHAFLIFSILRVLQPKMVVESGVWKGQGTWLIEQALPEVELVCLDPRPELRIYQSPNARYSSSDFSQIDWSVYPVEESLCLFDDHYSALARLQQMKWWGFKRAIFDDNYPADEGDAYSIRQVMAGSGHPSIQMSRGLKTSLARRAFRPLEEWILRRHSTKQSLIVDPNDVDLVGLRRNISLYFELPPLVLNHSTNWGTPWEGKSKPAHKPLLDSVQDLPELAHFLESIPLSRHFGELNYHFLCLLEL